MMMILERLYEGEIHPCQDIKPQSDEYRDANRKVESLMLQLSEELDASEYTKVEDICQQYSTMADQLEKESFEYGISIGLSLMKEAEKLQHLNEKRCNEETK